MSHDDPMRMMAAMMDKFQSVLDQNSIIQADLRKELQEERTLRKAAELRSLVMPGAAGDSKGPTIDALEKSISMFVYDPDDDVIFDGWYARYKEVFEEEAASLDDKAKVRMLMRHVSLPVAERYRDFIAPAEPTSISFEETVKSMSTLFGKTVSVFERRLQIIHLKMSQMGTDDVRVLACEVNKLFTRAALKNIDPEELRSTFFIAAMDSPRLTDVRMRLLKIVTENPQTTLNELVEECGKLAALKRDSAAGTVPTTNVVVKPRERARRTRRSSKSSRSSESSGDGGVHRKPGAKHRDSRDVRSTKCFFCRKKGHMARNCPEKQKTGRYANQSVQCHAITHERVYVTVNMRGQAVKMQVDSGSDVTIVSQKVWERLGRPKLQRVHEEVTCANDRGLMMKGKFRCTIEYKGMRGQGVVYVATDRCFLGLDWFNILKVHRAFFPADGFRVNGITIGRNVCRVKEHPSLYTPPSGSCTKVQAVLSPGEDMFFRAECECAGHSMADQSMVAEESAKLKLDDPTASVSEDEVSGRIGEVYSILESGRRDAHFLTTRNQEPQCSSPRAMVKDHRRNDWKSGTKESTRHPDYRKQRLRMWTDKKGPERKRIERNENKNSLPDAERCISPFEISARKDTVRSFRSLPHGEGSVPSDEFLGKAFGTPNGEKEEVWWDIFSACELNSLQKRGECDCEYQDVDPVPRMVRTRWPGNADKCVVGRVDSGASRYHAEMDVVAVSHCDDEDAPLPRDVDGVVSCADVDDPVIAVRRIANAIYKLIVDAKTVGHRSDEDVNVLMDVQTGRRSESDLGTKTCRLEASRQDDRGSQREDV